MSTLPIELQRVNSIINTFKTRKVLSVSYYGKTFKSLEEFLEHSKKQKV